MKDKGYLIRINWGSFVVILLSILPIIAGNIVAVYDPKVAKQRIYEDLDYIKTRSSEENRQLLEVVELTTQTWKVIGFSIKML